MKRSTSKKKPLEKKGPTKKDAAPKKFVLGAQLGQGGFATVYRILNKPEVLRIAVIRNQNDEEMVKRGLEILHVFQSFRRLLGPSLLIEVSNYRILGPEEELETYIEGRQLQKEAGREYVLQHIELLDGGMFQYSAYTQLKMTEAEVRFSVFSLIWFFAAGQQYFDYRHHDLKSANILIRSTPQRVNYNFQIGDKNGRFYHFESQIVPVVTDYDFASVETTQDTYDRNFPGTRYTSPPDALLHLLIVDNDDWTTFPQDFVYNEDSYDYWSLGICIFELLSPYVLHVMFLKQGDDFAEAVFNMHPTLKRTDTNQGLLRDIFYGACFASVVSKTPFTTLQPPNEHFPVFQNIDWVAMNKSVLPGKTYGALVELFHQQFPPGLKPLVQRLLSWDTDVRNSGGYPMRLILEFEEYFKAEKQRRPGTNYPYWGKNLALLENKDFLEDINIKDHPLLKNRFCETCLVSAKDAGGVLYFCECCAKPFCGKVCQRKKH